MNDFSRNQSESTEMIERLVRQVTAETRAAVEAEYRYRLEWYKNLLEKFKQHSGGVELHPSNVEDIGEAIKTREAHRDVSYRHSLIRARNVAQDTAARLNEVVRDLKLEEEKSEKPE